MDCQTAHNILTDFIYKREPAEAGVAAALEHCAACQVCQAGLGALVQAVRSGRSDDLPCAEARDRLAGYYAAQQEGDDPAQLFPAVAYHLRSCPYCAAEFASLVEMQALAAREPVIPAGEAAPRFDLSFVTAPGEAGWRQLGQQVRRLGQALQIWLEPGRAGLADLAVGLFPPAPAAAWRDAAPPAARLTIPDPAGGLQVHLGVSRDEAGQVTLLVTVEGMAPGRPLPPVKVSLQNQARDLLERQQAREMGQVAFEQLPPGRYWLVVQAGEQTWEISIPVTESEA